MSVRSGVGCPTRVIPRERSDRGNLAVRRTHQADNLAKLRQEFLSLLELTAKIFCAVSDCENKCGRWQSPLCFHFYLGDSHVASLLGMTFGAIAITAMPFEQISLLQ